jgi:hypothetical protein
MGYNAGQSNQGSQAIAMGYSAGQIRQGQNALAIGLNAGQSQQGTNAIAIGCNAGNSSQGYQAVAIGVNAGDNTQGQFSVAIGSSAGYSTQGTNAVAIGVSAGQNTQGRFAIAIGASAGFNTQGTNAVAIGSKAGQNSQGESAIAIGQNAGYNNQPANSIVLNASGSEVNGSTENAFYVRPIRNDTTATTVLGYDANTSEITYREGGGGGTGYWQPSTTPDAIYYNSGNVGIGTTTPTTALDVTGNCQALSFNTTSDYRIKENVKVLDNNYNVDNLRPVTYLNKSNGKQDIGFIAHELQEYFPCLVNGKKDDTYMQSLNYNGLVPILVKEIQDLKIENKLLIEKIEKIETIISKIIN